MVLKEEVLQVQTLRKAPQIDSTAWIRVWRLANSKHLWEKARQTLWLETRACIG